MISLKTCTKCGNTYPATSDYFPYQDKAKGKLHPWCRWCKKKGMDEYNRTYYERNREKILADSKAAYYADKTKQAERSKRYYQKNKAKSDARSKYHRRKYRREAIEGYGGKCECCGESHIEFLAIDHIDGGGGQHRKSLGGQYSFYRWLKKQGFPPGFRILCHNCNMAHGLYGYCPHEKEFAPPIQQQPLLAP